jgi:hypothetical protein
VSGTTKSSAGIGSDDVEARAGFADVGGMVFPRAVVALLAGAFAGLFAVLAIGSLLLEHHQRVLALSRTRSDRSEARALGLDGRRV